MRYHRARRIGKTGPVVVTFVDADMRRRTVAVPFARSDVANVGEILDHIVSEVGMFPPKLDRGTGSDA